MFDLNGRTALQEVAPTFVETGLTRERLQQPEFRSFVLGKISSGVLATPDDIAHAVVYLASDEAGMVNCVTLPATVAGPRGESPRLAAASVSRRAAYQWTARSEVDLPPRARSAFPGVLICTT
jgi:NAD(P)-dependent dehydrogenase (short-subunit alcohol dehydrogenase family)